MQHILGHLFGCRITDPILSFSGSYRFLSNFWSCPIVYDGETYQSSEHAYMCQKTFDEEARLRIKSAPTPAKAKIAGRAAPLRSDWEEIKIQVMYEVLLAKFTQNEDLKALLLATDDRYLEEGNTWGDVIWGVCNGKGRNLLGQILMLVRNHLQGKII
jgi:ribA/ribD-fused uncharacterized protein